MRQKLLLFFLTFLFISNSFGQKLTLTDLTTLCNKKNWQDVNQIMLVKGWTYYNSEKGDTDEYSTITWSYNKDDYSDKSQGWFYLYTFDGLPNKLSYSVFNKPSYLLIQNSLVSNGFKLVDSEIEDEKVISTYSNLGYTLIISNAKRKDDDWNDRSFVSYNITLIRKTGIFDNQNGKKTEYYDNGVIQAEYNLVNGKINGLLKFYDENGNLQKTTNFINGVANGKIVEYKENGEKNAEYLMSNDAKNGLLTFYENSNISYTANYKNNLKNGLYTSYYYTDDEKLFLKEYGQYIDEEKNGLWKTFYVEGKVEKLLTFTNYIKDIKDGSFQEVQNDSLIIGNYKNDELNGSYRIYRDLKKMFAGGITNTNPNELILITEGQYSQGKKTGNWKNYDLSKSLLNEGNYSENLEDGEWKYYYPSYVKEDNTKEPFSNELYLVENYFEGKLNGKSIRFSHFEDEEYACNEVDENGNKVDTCKRKVYVKLNEISNYKNGELNGSYELKNSENEIITKGFYIDNKENGFFEEKKVKKISDKQKVYITEKGNYKNGKKDGKWVEITNENKLARTINFDNGVLDGEYIEYNKFEKPEFIMQFENSSIKQLILNDSLGISKTDKFDVLERSDSYLKCVRTKYLKNSIVSQEFWMKNDNVEYYDCLLDFVIKTSDRTTENLGYKDGDYLLTTINEVPLEKGKYFKENKIGLWTYFFYDQKLKIDIKYEDNIKIEEVYLKLDGTLFSGEFEYVDIEKNLKEIRKIKDGLRNGKTSILDLKTNKIVNKETYKDGKLKE